MPVWRKIFDGAFDQEDVTDTTPLLSDTASDHSDFDPPATPAAKQPAWSEPIGAPSRSDNDEHLLMFRRAVGINSDLPASPSSGDHSALEQGVRRPAAVGIYRDVLVQERRKRLLHHAVTGVVWACHGTQVVLGATLTCLGLRADESSTAVAVLGAANTVVAGFLALVKGKSLPEKLGRAEAGFRRLRAWVEETESLLALGVIGRDRREVGLLVETAFRRYNACFGRSFEAEAAVDRGLDSFSVTSEGEVAENSYPG